MEIADFSYQRFVEDSVALSPHGGPLDSDRLLAALQAVAEAVSRGSGPSDMQYVGLVDVLKRSVAEARSSDDQVALVRAGSPALAALIELFEEAHELVSDGLGVPALTRLLTDPQRLIRLDDETLVAGMFTTDGDDTRLAMSVRWRLIREGAHARLEFGAFDERRTDAVPDAESFLSELAFEVGARSRHPRARAALIVSPLRLDAMASQPDFERRVTAMGVVLDVVIEIHPVADPQRLGAIDREIAERGYDILILWVDPSDQWGWRRADSFEAHGGSQGVLSALDANGAAEQLLTGLRDLVGGVALPAPGDVEHRGESSLEPAQVARMRASVSASPLLVVFVGGNETQAQYRTGIELELSARFGAVTVVWFEGWGSNWNRTADAASRHFITAEALVLMPFVRTELGRTLRKRASENGIPEIPCTGRGRQSLLHAIETAVAVAISERSA